MDDERWTADGNYLEPFRSPALNFTHERRGTVQHFVVRKRRPDGDSITIDVTCSSVRVVAGALGVAPLYVATTADAEQRGRRAAIVRALGLRDIAIMAADHLPFDGNGVRACQNPHDADGDVYREAFDTLRDRARATDAQVVMTGFGGDEMLALRHAERSMPLVAPAVPAWLGPRTRRALAELDVNVAPVSAVAVPCLMAFAARHPAYLHTGLWPVAPLAQPELLRLGEALPAPSRTGNALLAALRHSRRRDRAVQHDRQPEKATLTDAGTLARTNIAYRRPAVYHELTSGDGQVDTVGRIVTDLVATSERPRPGLRHRPRHRRIPPHLRLGRAAVGVLREGCGRSRQGGAVRGLEVLGERIFDARPGHPS